jgi:hypothetical protein
MLVLLAAASPAAAPISANYSTNRIVTGLFLSQLALYSYTLAQPSQQTSVTLHSTIKLDKLCSMYSFSTTSVQP